MTFTFSNFLSLLRGPLAFLFLIDNPIYRAAAVVLAMITDCLDGFLARRYKKVTQLGAFLDPLMDKFFVFFCVATLLNEQALTIWQALSLLSRDFAILLFGIYLALRKSWADFQFRSIWTGKITTALQFFVLLALIFKVKVPEPIFICFIALGILALFELYFIERQIMRGKWKNYS